MGASGKSSIPKVAERYPMNRTRSALVWRTSPYIALATITLWVALFVSSAADAQALYRDKVNERNPGGKDLVIESCLLPTMTSSSG
jgi:hypothetical protein